MIIICLPIIIIIIATIITIIAIGSSFAEARRLLEERTLAARLRLEDNNYIIRYSTDFIVYLTFTICLFIINGFGPAGGEEGGAGEEGSDRSNDNSNTRTMIIQILV